MGLVAGAFAGQYLIEFAGNPGGRNIEMAGVGKKPAVGYGKQKETGQVGYVDADGYAQPDPTADKKTKLAQSLETALTGGYSAEDYKKNPQPAPSFDYSETTPHQKRDAWVDGQKPSAQTIQEYKDRRKKEAEAEAAPEKQAKSDALKLQKMRAEIKNQRADKDFSWDGKNDGVSFDKYLQDKYGFELWQKS